VIRAINEYLDPLGRRQGNERGSCAGASSSASGTAPQSGWSFGRELFPTNLFSVILRVPDVVSVVHLDIQVDGRPHELSSPVRVRPDGLLYGVADHEIVVVPSVDL
jgi:hypothetical protein